MKKQKILLTIGGVFLLVILIGVSYYFIFHKAKDFYNENNKIVSKEEYLGYKSIIYGTVNYYINNGNKIIGFDKDSGNKLFEIEMPLKEFYKMVNSTEDIISLYSYRNEEDSEYKLFSINGDLLKTSKDIIKVSNDIYNNKSYYIYEKSLFNDNNELVFENLLKEIDLTNISFRFNVYGSFVLFTNNSRGQLLNLENNEKIDIKSYFKNDKYVEIEARNNFYLLNIENDELLEYAKYEDKPYGKILYKNEEKYIYTHSQIIRFEDRLIYEGYQLDFTTCKDGFNIYYNDSLLSSECYYNYGKDAYNNDYVSNSKSFYLKDGKLDDKISIGKYFIKGTHESEDIIVYNENEEQISTTCNKEFSYYRNGLYVCNNGESTYLVNESLKKVTDSYDELVCSNTYCKIFKDEKYGLLYDDKVVLQPTYEKIILENNAIVAEDVYKLDYFLLGTEEPLKEDKLYREVEDYKNINVNQVINEYDLKEIENFINSDNEFFKQYAYIVQNNNDLGDFKKYVLYAYKEVILNKEYLDKEYFLYNLKQLSIEQNEKVSDMGLTGFYTNNTIHILYLENIKTLYHELTHFIDDRINKTGIVNNIQVYKYLDNYILSEEYEKLSKEEKKKIDTLDIIDFNFLTEGGAEYFTGGYFNNMKTYTYAVQVSFCNIFSYMYGSDFMREIFFDRNGHELLYKKFVDAGYNYDEIKRFSEITTRNEIVSASNKDKMYYIDMIIRLYEYEKETKWYEDDIFSYYIKNLVPYNLKKSDTSRYDEYSKIINEVSNIQRKIYEKLDNSPYTRINGVMHFDDTIYVSVDASRIIDKELKNQLLVFTYDFANEELLEYKTIDE